LPEEYLRDVGEWYGVEWKWNLEWRMEWFEWKKVDVDRFHREMREMQL